MTKKQLNFQKQQLLYKDFKALFDKELKAQKKTTKSLKNDFKKLLDKETFTNNNRVKNARARIASKNFKKQSIVKGRETKKRVIIPKQDLNYTAFQKDFMLAKPIKVVTKFLNNFTNYLNENFRDSVRAFYLKHIPPPRKYKYTYGVVGYHFFFYYKNREKVYQSGFTQPREDLYKEGIEKAIDKLFNFIFKRYEAYFKFKKKSQLYFEGLTAEISYDN